jgi:cation:H+ antiporter
LETLLTIAGGLVLLTAGGEGVVRGAVGVARRLGVSELLIGLTLVAFGTSAPELLTSVQAALAGSPGIAVGNVVGSNIGNILLIFAIVAMVRPVAVDPAAIRRDGLVMLLVTLMFVAIAASVGVLARWVGGVLVALLVAYVLFAWWTERDGGPAAERHAGEGEQKPTPGASLGVSLLFAFGGLVLLVVGADLLVGGAIVLARTLGLSETVIGLTIVAIGTSLPELVASLAAALKGRADVAFGNIVGSNIYNVLGILGITALVAPVSVPPDMMLRDWAAMIGSAALLLVHAWTGARVSRAEGGVLLLGYAVYAWLLLPSG